MGEPISVEAREVLRASIAARRAVRLSTLHPAIKAGRPRTVTVDAAVVAAMRANSKSWSAIAADLGCSRSAARRAVECPAKGSR